MHRIWTELCGTSISCKNGWVSALGWTALPQICLHLCLGSMFISILYFRVLKALKALFRISYTVCCPKALQGTNVSVETVRNDFPNAQNGWKTVKNGENSLTVFDFLLRNRQKATRAGPENSSKNRISETPQTINH